MAEHINNRRQLLEWLDPHIPIQYRSVARSVREGSIEFLGGFNHIPPSNRPGWIVRSRSKFRRYHYVAVIPQFMKLCHIIILDKIPWQYWNQSDSENSFYAGDRPDLYRRLRNAKTKKR